VGGCFRSIIGVGEWVTKSDIRLARERVKRLEKEVELFQTWFDRGGELREKILKKVSGVRRIIHECWTLGL